MTIQEELDQARTDLQAAVEAKETAIAELDTCKARVTEIEEELNAAKSAQETAVESARKEGESAATERIKARHEKLQDAELVLETAAMDDDEYKDVVIERLQSRAVAKSAEDGTNAIEHDVDAGDGSTPEATFENKVQENMDQGMSRGQAISRAAREFPKLHQEWKAAGGTFSRV